MTSTIWSAGRYEAVAQRIAGIAETVVSRADSRLPLQGSAVVDLACGTGSAALSAARQGARVTAVDITSELIEIGARNAHAAAFVVDWRTGDAAATGLPDAAFDAAVSNMGIIFVEPRSQVAELARLLKPGGVLSFSSWVRDTSNPLYDPIVRVLGAPPARTYAPDQWGEQSTVTQRLAADFEGIEFSPGVLRWEFGSAGDALRFVTQESPMHVDILGRLDADERRALTSAFESELADWVEDTGQVAFNASYVVVTAIRR